MNRFWRRYLPWVYLFWAVVGVVYVAFKAFASAL